MTKNVWVVGDDGIPIRAVVETDDEIPCAREPIGDSLVVGSLLRSVVYRAIDVDRGVRILVEDIRPADAGGNQILAMAGQPQVRFVDARQPSALQLGVAAPHEPVDVVLPASRSGG